MKESRFKSLLIRELTLLFPGCVVISTDPTNMRSFPDILVLHEDRWFAIETKKNKEASKQPNQSYYIDLLNAMGTAYFIDPSNKKEVLRELEYIFAS